MKSARKWLPLLAALAVAASVSAASQKMVCTLTNKEVKTCCCEVIEGRCPPMQLCQEGKAYGVRAMPTVVVDGTIMFEGRVTREQAALLTR